MIVVGIIGILAAVAVPKFGEAIEKANLGTSLGNLAAIRSAVTIYYSSYAIMPKTLDIENPLFKHMMGDVMPAVKSHYPALHDPSGNTLTYGNNIPSDYGRGWYYNTNNGDVYINSIEKDIKGINYTMY